MLNFRKRTSVGLDIETNITGQKKSSVDVTVTMKVAEMTRLREKCNFLEESECSLKSLVEKLKLTLKDKDETIEKQELECHTYQRDLENYVAKTNVSVSFLQFI